MDQDATLSMEVGLSQGDIVLDGDPAPPTERGTAVPAFQPTARSGTVAHLINCWALVFFWIAVKN